MTLLSEKFSFSRPKILMTFFSPYLYCFKCRIRPFLHKKNHYFRNEFLDDTILFTLFVLSRASDNTTSQNIGGTDAWAVPTSNFGGDRPSQSP